MLISIDVIQCIISQLPKTLTVDEVDKIIKHGANFRDKKYYNLSKSRGTRTPTDFFADMSDEDLYYMLKVNTSKYYTKKEKAFVDEYDIQFKEKFYSTEEAAAKNYLNLVQNDVKMLLEILLEDFNY